MKPTFDELRARWRDLILTTTLADHDTSDQIVKREQSARPRHDVRPHHWLLSGGRPPRHDADDGLGRVISGIDAKRRIIHEQHGPAQVSIYKHKIDHIEKLSFVDEVLHSLEQFYTSAQGRFTRYVEVRHLAPSSLRGSVESVREKIDGLMDDLIVAESRYNYERDRVVSVNHVLHHPTWGTLKQGQDSYEDYSADQPTIILGRVGYDTPLVRYAAVDTSSEIDQLGHVLIDKLLIEIPRAIAAANLTEPMFGLALLYVDPVDFFPPDLRCGVISARGPIAAGKKHNRPSMWIDPFVDGHDADNPPQITDATTLALCAQLQTVVDGAEDLLDEDAEDAIYDYAESVLQIVARQLSHLDWTGIAPVTDDFVCFIADYEIADDASLASSIAAAAKSGLAESFRQKGWLPPAMW